MIILKLNKNEEMSLPVEDTPYCPNLGCFLSLINNGVSKSERDTIPREIDNCGSTQWKHKLESNSQTKRRRTRVQSKGQHS